MNAVSVEWLLHGGHHQLFSNFLSFTKNLKIGLSLVGKMCIVCAIEKCALTCLYLKTAADYFGSDCPVLQEYLQILPNNPVPSQQTVKEGYPALCDFKTSKLLNELMSARTQLQVSVCFIC